jgi:hypothetical protein
MMDKSKPSSNVTNKKNPYVFDPKTDKVERRNPTPVDVMERKAKEAFTGVATQKVKSVERLAKPYEGADSLMEFHKAKAKSSLSETYKDADYATAGWKTNSEWDDFTQFVKDTLIVIPLLGLFLFFVYAVFVCLEILVVRV